MQVRGWVAPESGRFEPFDTPARILAPLAVLMVFAVANHGLTQGVISLVARRRFFHWSLFTKTGLPWARKSSRPCLLKAI